jgi:hypothetical protein
MIYIQCCTEVHYRSRKIPSGPLGWERNMTHPYPTLYNKSVRYFECTVKSRGTVVLVLN